MSNQIPNIKEKLGAALTYLTLGIWGLIWLLLSRKHYYDQKDFVRFHCFQSIFLGVLYMFIPQGIAILFSLTYQVLRLIPGTSFVTSGIDSVYGLLQILIKYGSLILIVYCVIFCIYGKYTNIPWVSQLINRMLR